MRKALYFLAALLIFSIRSEAKPDSLKITFTFRSQRAGSVALAGSFNQWNPQACQLIKNDSLWRISIKLLPGYYYYKFVVDGQWIPDPENPLRINDGDTSYNSIIKVGNPPVPERKSSQSDFPQGRLPRPVLESNPDLVTLYYAAWKMAWNKIARGNSLNGFSERYMDEGFNELIFQWDTCFMVLFGIYAPDIFPAMASLDNFYSRQQTDGYIQRVYFEADGSPAEKPTKEEPVINPPLFAWIELKYYEITGDSSRLRRVLPVLIRYYNWIENNCRAVNNSGLFYTTQLGSGMDNIPRPGTEGAGWIDFSSQQALSARCISDIAELTGEMTIARQFENRFLELSEAVNRNCWSEEKKFYFDQTRSGSLCSTKHIGAYWTLISGITDSIRAKEMARHLMNPNEFKRPMMIPALSKDHPEYNPGGHYWKGGIWAPTNYMAVKGLEKAGFRALADEIAENYIKNINYVYWNFSPSEDSIAFEERYNDQYHTIWECYSPEAPRPATRWDNTFYSRQDFVGWSGLGPISMLIENILGITLKGSHNSIYWRIHRNDTHGIENLRLRDQQVSLIARPGREGTSITVKYSKPFTLELEYSGETYSYTIPLSESNKTKEGEKTAIILLGMRNPDENK